MTKPKQESGIIGDTVRVVVLPSGRTINLKECFHQCDYCGITFGYGYSGFMSQEPDGRWKCTGCKKQP